MINQLSLKLKSFTKRLPFLNDHDEKCKFYSNDLKIVLKHYNGKIQLRNCKNIDISSQLQPLSMYK